MQVPEAMIPAQSPGKLLSDRIPAPYHEEIPRAGASVLKTSSSGRSYMRKISNNNNPEPRLKSIVPFGRCQLDEFEGHN